MLSHSVNFCNTARMLMLRSSQRNTEMDMPYSISVASPSGSTSPLLLSHHERSLSLLVPFAMEEEMGEGRSCLRKGRNSGIWDGLLLVSRQLRDKRWLVVEVATSPSNEMPCHSPPRDTGESYPRCHRVHSSRNICPDQSVRWRGHGEFHLSPSIQIATGRSCLKYGLHGD